MLTPIQRTRVGENHSYFKEVNLRVLWSQLRSHHKLKTVLINMSADVDSWEEVGSLAFQSCVHYTNIRTKVNLRFLLTGKIHYFKSRE